MHIKSISVNNFRLLKESTLNLNQDKKQILSLLIGKNNSGKTSFIVLFDKFFRNESYKFNFNDFPVSIRKEILDINSESDLSPITIQMKIEIAYTPADNLETLSDFILDLDPEENTVKILFECSIDQTKLLKDLFAIQDKHRKKFIENHLEEYLINLSLIHI